MRAARVAREWLGERLDAQWRGGEWDATISQIVLDDLIELGTGDKCVVDGTVTESDGLEIDESLLTGEPDPVPKHPGDRVLSGSFVVSGGGAFGRGAGGRVLQPVCHGTGAERRSPKDFDFTVMPVDRPSQVALDEAFDLRTGPSSTRHLLDQ